MKGYLRKPIPTPATLTLTATRDKPAPPAEAASGASGWHHHRAGVARPWRRFSTCPIADSQSAGPGRRSQAGRLQSLRIGNPRYSRRAVCPAPPLPLPAAARTARPTSCAIDRRLGRPFRLARALYQRAAAIELAHGAMEALATGGAALQRPAEADTGHAKKSRGQTPHWLGRCRNAGDSAPANPLCCLCVSAPWRSKTKRQGAKPPRRTDRNTHPQPNWHCSRRRHSAMHQAPTGKPDQQRPAAI